MITRREALQQSVAAASMLVSWPSLVRADETHDRLAALERRYGGRLGVAALDLGSGVRVEQRANERFAMCSTFKLLAVGVVLTRVDRLEEQLDRRVVFGKEALVTYSPATEKRVGAPGMTVAELCEAALTLSDNTAGNLLLASFGGPPALTEFARSLDDAVTRLDRIETELNEATPGDPRDTTTPRAMLEHVQRLVLGEALSPESCSQLTSWLIANRTGDDRLRAGLPKDWRVGDKTGAGNHGATNDVAVAWPPGRAPLLMSVYYAESSATPEQRNAVIADVARILSVR